MTTNATSSNKEELSFFLIIILSLGFASTQLSWALFNIAIPIILDKEFGLPLAMIGIIMTWDNIIAFFVQPVIGSYSDKTRTRFGRRFPFIIPGIIFGGLFFILLPITKELAIYIFLANIVLFNLAMSLYRSPTVSLLPDLVKSERRSIGNGIVNTMGGVFAGVSLFVGGTFLRNGQTFTAFAFVSVGMIISLVILVSVIKEPKEFEEPINDRQPIFRLLKNEIKRITTSEDKSLFYMLLAILTWFISWNAIEAFYSTFVWKTFLPDLDGEEAAGEAAKVLFIFPVVFVIFTLVGGYLGGKIGRIITMKIGLFFMGFGLVIANFIKKDALFGLEIGWKTSFMIIFTISAIGWGFVNVNSIVVVWEHSIDNGTGTGMYYAFSSAAAILGPTISGVLMGITNVKMLFPFSIIFIIISFLFLFNVKTGEAGFNATIE